MMVVPFVAIMFCSCRGDHGTQGGKDTGENTYGVAKDTSKMDSTGADTASLDNSGSGGTKIAKPDSSK